MALLTPQGRAIQEAAVKFGDGQTLPFTPCKKGYIPVLTEKASKGRSNNSNYKRMYACPLHDEARRKRLQKEGGLTEFRKGEVNLTLFWDRYESTQQTQKIDGNSRKKQKLETMPVQGK